MTRKTLLFFSGQSCPTLCEPMDCSTPGFPVLDHFPKFAQVMSIASVMPSSHLTLWCPLLLCSQSFPSSGTFPMSQPFASNDQNTGMSASVLPSTQGWFPLRLAGWSPCYPRDSQESSPTPQFKGMNSRCSAFFRIQLSQPYVTTGKIIALTIWTVVSRMTKWTFSTYCLGLS